MRKIKCTVCGTKFKVLKEQTYRIEVNVFDKIMEVIEPRKVYDAIDCPVCGCQRRLTLREKDVEGC